MADGSKAPLIPPPPGSAGVLAAALVHVFTASGIICALLATLAVLQGGYATAFGWLGLAFIIDGVDGTFARMADVSRRLPRFSGERLDNVVDYVTYVFVPVLALLQSGILSGASGIVLGAMILMSSLYHFSDNGSKTEDHCFVGFPAIWNIVAFYLFAFRLPGWIAAAIIVVCIALTFVPMRWLHPVRVERLLGLNIAATILWLLAAAVTLWSGFPAGPLAGSILALVGLYGLALTLIWPWADPEGHGKKP